MTELVGNLTATATVEVRDADGNLISTEPITLDFGGLTAEQLRDLTEGEQA